MSSILTNNGAMVALQTLKTINMDMEDLQSKISTGKKVANASDNSAVWAIAKTMESDVGGFMAVSESLSLGGSKVAVAQNAAESITDLLKDMKEKIISAQDATGDDQTKIQADIDALKDQVEAVVGAAQFNGTNLVNGTGGTSILSSLNRDASGNVTAESITVDGQDLSTGGYAGKSTFVDADTVIGTSVISTTTLATSGAVAGDSFSATLNAGDTTGFNFALDNSTTFAAGDKISITIGDQTVNHVVTAANLDATKPEDVIAASLKTAIDDLGITGLKVDFTSTATGGELTILSEAENLAATPPVLGTQESLSISGQFTNAGSGGLGLLDGIDVTSDPVGALSSIESLISTAIDAASSFGSAAGRIEKQSSFVSNLSDALTSGVGSLVDADMEKASARLKALQTQQQLGAQALSIANSAPQSLLSLFR
ncbi:flagellin [Epibacterium ulvae]|uniref:flagellin n=1 Tax=Epibacterium ulvae TaxID=1156985 RepID=UPI00248F7194|nr:flagellin [Epibacterium ulvae]